MSRLIRFVGVSSVVLGLCSVASAEEWTTGTIRSTETSPNRVIIKGVVKDTTYELTKNVSIWLDGRSAKLGDLKADDQATLGYEKKGDHFMAREVRALRNAKEVRGTVRDVFKDKREVTLKGTVKDTTYELDKNGTVYANGKKGSLVDVREGDEVLITYEKRGDHWMANDVTVVKRK